MKTSRRASRSLAFQALYGQEFVPCARLEDVQRAFLSVPHDGETGEAVLSGFAWELVKGVWEKREELDQVIVRFARNWRLERLGRVELTLLRLAVYEMLYRPDVPPKVVMNEALELNRQFGEEQYRAFVNGILDAAGKALGSPANSGKAGD